MWNWEDIDIPWILILLTIVAFEILLVFLVFTGNIAMFQDCRDNHANHKRDYPDQYDTESDED